MTALSEALLKYRAAHRAHSATYKEWMATKDAPRELFTKMKGQELRLDAACESVALALCDELGFVLEETATTEDDYAASMKLMHVGRSS